MDEKEARGDRGGAIAGSAGMEVLAGVPEQHDCAALARARALIDAAAAGNGGQRDGPVLAGAMKDALRDEPPPFATDLYRDLYLTLVESVWDIVVELLLEAEREAERSRRWLARAAAGADEAETMKTLAEAGGAMVRSLLEFLDTSFPDAIEPGFRASLEALEPDFSVTGLSAEDPPDLSVESCLADTVADFRSAAVAGLRCEAAERLCRPDRRRRLRQSGLALRERQARRLAPSIALAGRLTRGRSAPELYRLASAAFARSADATAEERVDLAFHSRFGDYP
jgi:hypothetical protein